jgi:hypothetical protein
MFLLKFEIIFCNVETHKKTLFFFYFIKNQKNENLLIYSKLQSIIELGCKTVPLDCKQTLKNLRRLAKMDPTHLNRCLSDQH